MTIARTWGTSPEERALAYACDRDIDAPRDELYRGVTVEAHASVVFRWLCQLRAAPDSYDWIDNFGRRSPQRFTPGLERLEPGQRVMTIFALAEFVQDRQITIQVQRSRLFGSLALTYMRAEQPGGTTRLLAKISSHHARGIRATMLRAVLPWGDLVMMRRQLLNLKRLAEQSARETAA
jgi:hypothetical protein